MNQLIRFLLTGGIAAIANITSRTILSEIFTFSIAIAIAFCIGLVTAFILMKLFVFEASTIKTKQQFIWFTLFNLLGLALTWLISISIAQVLQKLNVSIFLAELIGHSLGVCFPVFLSFVAHKYVSFR